MGTHGNGLARDLVWAVGAFLFSPLLVLGIFGGIQAGIALTGLLVLVAGLVKSLVGPSPDQNDGRPVQASTHQKVPAGTSSPSPNR